MLNCEQDNTQNPSPCVDNSTENVENSLLNTEKSEIISQGKEKCVENSDAEPLTDEKSDKSQPKITNLSFEEHISKDFQDFEAIFPNISKSSLLNDDNLRSFAEGKEGKRFSVVYAQYCNLIKSISAQAIKQDKMIQLSAQVAVGELSSPKSSNEAYFTKEQVLKMSQQEIKRNYEKIRASQANW